MGANTYLITIWFHGGEMTCPIHGSVPFPNGRRHVVKASDPADALNQLAPGRDVDRIEIIDLPDPE